MAEVAGWGSAELLRVRNGVAPPPRKGFSVAPLDYSGMNDAAAAKNETIGVELAIDKK